MRDYELMLLMNPTFDSDAIEQLIGKSKDLIEKNGGKVGKVDRWGQKKLAYPVEKHNLGFYTVVDFAGETETVEELDRVLKITDGIMRYLIARSNGE